MSTPGDDHIRVLLVDDDPDLADIVALRLEELDDRFDVAIVETSREALDRIQRASVDCLVSDHEMPGMDGLELLRAVREDFPDLPFILYTGKGSEGVASEAISAGVTDYVEKQAGTDQYAVLANRIENAVTEQRATSALEESERRLSTLISNLPGMAYRCRNEPGWPMEFVSEGAVELTGYTAAELQSGAVSWGEDVIVDADREQMWERVQVAVAAGEPYEVTYRIETKDGTERWLWERGRGVYEGDTAPADSGTDVDTEGTGDGDPIALEGFITDITARRERERELEAIQKRYRTLLDTAPEAVILADAETGTIVDANQAVGTLLGVDPDSVVGDALASMTPDGDVDGAGALFDSHWDGEDTLDLPDGAELELLRADGDRVPVEVSASVVDLDERTLLQGFFRDVSERKRREQELERFETIIQAVGDPVYALDDDGRFTFVNDAMAAVTGYPSEELVGSSIERVMDDAEVERGTDLIRTLLRHDDRQYETFEMDLHTQGGGRIPCENHIALLPLDDGAFTGTAGVIRDITERKRREQRLEQFASVVSHDLRNPLNVVMGRLEIVQQSGDTAHLDAALDATEQMQDLIDDLLTLAQQGETVGDTYSVSLTGVVSDAVDRVALGETTVTVTEDLQFEADPDRLGELFTNLFSNASRHGDADRVRVGALADGEGFFVADDGTGVPEAERGAVFEYGHTTADDGTGFGLTIVENIVEAHGWSISLTESDEGGARFEIDVTD